MKKRLLLRNYVLFTFLAILIGLIAYSGYEIYKIVEEDNT